MYQRILNDTIINWELISPKDIIRRDEDTIHKIVYYLYKGISSIMQAIAKILNVYNYMHVSRKPHASQK